MLLASSPLASSIALLNTMRGNLQGEAFQDNYSWIPTSPMSKDPGVFSNRVLPSSSVPFVVSSTEQLHPPLLGYVI